MSASVDSAGYLRYRGDVVFCKNRLLALCVGTILVFFAESKFCFAERIGLIQCMSDVEQHQSAGTSEQQSNPHYCQTHSDGATIIAYAVGVPAGDLLGNICAKREATAPEGPVRDIDHPPQLS